MVRIVTASFRPVSRLDPPLDTDDAGEINLVRAEHAVKAFQTCDHADWTAPSPSEDDAEATDLETSDGSESGGICSIEYPRSVSLVNRLHHVRVGADCTEYFARFPFQFGYSQYTNVIEYVTRHKVYIRHRHNPGAFVI